MNLLSTAEFGAASLRKHPDSINLHLNFEIKLPFSQLTVNQIDISAFSYQCLDFRTKLLQDISFGSHITCPSKNKAKGLIFKYIVY
jgi:hypothetical protein